MAQMIITFKVMPESAELDIKDVESKIEEKTKEFGASYGKGEIIPVAFGLKALNAMIIIDEAKSIDDLQKILMDIEGVGSCEVIDMRRAIG